VINSRKKAWRFGRCGSEAKSQGVLKCGEAAECQRSGWNRCLFYINLLVKAVSLPILFHRSGISFYFLINDGSC